MLDVVSMLATLPILADDEYALTNSFSSSLMSAASLNAEVVVEASVIRSGRNLIFTQSSAWKFDQDGKRTQIASAQLSKFRFKRQW
jgi:acyl-coenzyme A thioesterase 13